MSASNRAVDDPMHFGHIAHSVYQKWEELLKSDSSFHEQLASSFAAYLSLFKDAAAKGAYWDAERVYLNARDLKALGFWEQMRLEIFLERFKHQIHPHVAEAVRQGVEAVFSPVS